MALVGPTCYALEATEAPQWTVSQEKSIATDYPFDLHHESPQQFVTRTYLQFLWLPQSIMPLQMLVPSLQRVTSSPTSSQQSPHSLHPLLDPLLQTTRSISNKYHVELVQILTDGGGAGEMEETMMWYALHHEKKVENHKQSESDIQAPWADPKWRQRWLERLEQREIQIQILLYMAKLSLPGPAPVPPPSKKRKRLRKEPDTPVPTLEERLESFMDKISVLQLTSNLEISRPGLGHSERDWAQIFCEDIVESTFKLQLPEICSLLRTKVFPTSPFSDDDTATASRSPSPELPQPKVDSSGSSLAPSTSLSASGPGPFPLARRRSRSLSVSLAQEKEERERSAGTGPGKKRVLNREVSMSRVFKPKAKTSTKPVDHVPNHQAKAKDKVQESEVILVEDTPQKPRVSSRNISQQQFDTGSSDNLFGGGQSSQKLFGRHMNGTDDDDAWMLDSSPDILLLHPGRKSDSSEDEYEGAMLHTPSRKSCRRS